MAKKDVWKSRFGHNGRGGHFRFLGPEVKYPRTEEIDPSSQWVRNRYAILVCRRTKTETYEKWRTIEVHLVLNSWDWRRNKIGWNLKELLWFCESAFWIGEIGLQSTHTNSQTEFEISSCSTESKVQALSPTCLASLRRMPERKVRDNKLWHNERRSVRQMKIILLVCAGGANGWMRNRETSCASASHSHSTTPHIHAASNRWAEIEGD